LIYLVVVVVGGALLAPGVYNGIQASATQDWFAWLGHYPFRRVFNRCVLVVALAGLWPLWRSLGIKSWGAVGYARQPDWWRQILSGAAVGAVALLLAVLVTRRSLAYDRDTLEMLHLVGKLLMTACIVSVIEETFFRGGLQGSLQRRVPMLPSLVVSSLIYSVVHFIKPSKEFVMAAPVPWNGGFVYLQEVALQSFVGRDFVVEFVSLALLGGILGWLYWRTRALYWPLGLHAGLVFANELVRAGSGGKVAQDPAAWVILILLWLALAWWWRRDEVSELA
jgi:membrane protease YdiL (CAAX protease family)